MKLLTIGIPVYNGELFIGKVIDSIVNELSTINPNEIEVLVSNNASTDNTDKIVESYRELYPSLIKSYKNDKNYGYDRNIDLIIERANGKYIWFLGCGDNIKSGAIKYILDRLKKEEYSNVLLNFDIFSESSMKIEKISNFCLTKDRVFDSRDQFIIEFGGPALAVSANIISKQLWLEVINRKLFMDGWCHIERIYDMLFSPSYMKTLYIGSSCFTLYREIDGWWTGEKVYFNFINFIKIIVNKVLKENELSSNAKKSLLKRHYPWPLLRSILLGKKIGLKFNYNLLVEEVKLFYRKLSFWIIIFPVLLIPGILIRSKLCRAFYYLFQKHFKMGTKR